MLLALAIVLFGTPQGGSNKRENPYKLPAHPLPARRYSQRAKPSCRKCIGQPCQRHFNLLKCFQLKQGITLVLPWFT